MDDEGVRKVLIVPGVFTVLALVAAGFINLLRALNKLLPVYGLPVGVVPPPAFPSSRVTVDPIRK